MCIHVLSTNYRPMDSYSLEESVRIFNRAFEILEAMDFAEQIQEFFAECASHQPWFSALVLLLAAWLYMLLHDW